MRGVLLRNGVDRILLGAVVYPAAVVGGLLLLSSGHWTLGKYVILALPALLFGAIVARPWILAVPVAYVAIWLLVSVLRDPSCTSTCGVKDTWVVIVTSSIIFIAVPQLVGLLTGLGMRRVVAGREAPADSHLGGHSESDDSGTQPE